MVQIMGLVVKASVIALIASVLCHFAKKSMDDKGKYLSTLQEIIVNFIIVALTVIGVCYGYEMIGKGSFGGGSASGLLKGDFSDLPPEVVI